MKWCCLSIYFCIDNFKVMTRLLYERQITGLYIKWLCYGLGGGGVKYRCLVGEN